MNSPLVGVWELTTETLNGLMIFTETHECHLFNRPNRQPFAKPGEPTDAEEAAAFRTMYAGAGTYSIAGSTITMNEEYDRIPDNPHKWILEFSIEGEVLTLQTTWNGNTYKLKKVG
jgi:hypothetical protein